MPLGIMGLMLAGEAIAALRHNGFQLPKKRDPSRTAKLLRTKLNQNPGRAGPTHTEEEEDTCYDCNKCDLPHHD